MKETFRISPLTPESGDTNKKHYYFGEVAKDKLKPEKQSIESIDELLVNRLTATAKEIYQIIKAYPLTKSSELEKLYDRSILVKALEQLFRFGLIENDKEFTSGKYEAQYIATDKNGQTLIPLQ
jgi:hypothetical protein